MNNDYSEFVWQVMEYAIDSASEPVIRLAGREIGTLTEGTFVDKLYIAWPDQDFETRLFERLLASTQLTCVAAYRGCGKTSAIRHAVARLQRDHPDVIPVVIDVKKLYDAGAFSPLPDKPGDAIVATAYHIFKSEIRKVVQQRLLPGPENTQKLLAWTLAGPPDATDTFSDLLVASVIDISDPVIVSAKATKKTRRERMAAIAHFLNTPKNFIECHREAIAHIGTAHVVRAAMAHFGWHRVVLVFDNIDRIALPYQVKFMEAVNDTHNALGGACGTVVAVRRETLRWPVPRANEKGDPIDIIAPNEAEYPAILFPDTKPAHVSRILQARHDYSVDLYQHHVEHSAEDVKRVTALHASVVDEFVRDSIHALANGSIRALTKIYTGFFKYVQRAETATALRGQERALKSDEGYLQTLFFLFLRENAKEYGLVYHEIVRPEADRIAATDVPDLASPHHLLLTILLNLTKELGETAGSVHDATFNQICVRMATLGFTLDDVRGAVSELHAEQGEAPRTIEFMNVDPDVSALPLSSQARISLTPLGHLLVTGLLHKVGYIWGQAYDSYVRSSTSSRREPVKAYYQLSPADRIKVFFNYTRDLMVSHLKLLTLVRKRLHPRHGKKWMDVYRAHFAVGGQFHVERLCFSAAAFYDPHIPQSQANPFRNLADMYSTLRDQVDDGVAFDDLPTAKMLWRVDDFYSPGGVHL